MTFDPHAHDWPLSRPEPRPRPDDGPAPGFGDRLLDVDEPPPGAARAGRRGFREKLLASLRGIKLAVRGDSSFFAHGYRFLLVALAAARLGVDPLGWCLLGIGATLVLMAELTHSAIDTLARAVGDPDEPRLKTAREIATGGVLVAVSTWVAISIVVLVLKLGDLLGWWG